MSGRGANSFRRDGVPRWITRAVWTAAIVAALLWVVGVFAEHPVLFPAGPNFLDITVYKGRFTLYHSAAFFRPGRFSAFAYPAGAALIYEAFYRTGDTLRSYWAVSVLCVTAAVVTAVLRLRRIDGIKLLLPGLMLSYPLVFLLQRANIELVLWAVVGAGILAYACGWRMAAAVLFGVAGAVKLYPAVLLGLFLTSRDRRHPRDQPAFVLGVATFMVAMVAAIAYAGPTFPVAAHGFFAGVDRFQDHYVDTIRSTERAFDHCLLSPFKLWSHSEHVHASHFLTLYYVVAGSAALLLFLRVRTLPFLNRVVFLTAAMVSLPPVSYAYTLVHLFLPALLLAAGLAARRNALSAKVALGLLLCLFLPLNALSAWQPFPAGPVQSIALAVLLVITMSQAWPETAADGACRPAPEGI